MQTLIIDHDDNPSDSSINTINNAGVVDDLITNTKTSREDNEKLNSIKENNSKTKEINLEINGLTYVFDFPVNQNSNPKPAAEMLAQKFCSIHGQNLGLTLEEMNTTSIITQKCAQPLTVALIQEIGKEVGLH